MEKTRKKSIKEKLIKLNKHEPIKIQTPQNLEYKNNEIRKETMSQTFISQTPNSNKFIKLNLQKSKNNPSSFFSKDSSQSTKISEISKNNPRKISDKIKRSDFNKLLNNNQPVKIINKKGIFPSSPKERFRDFISSKDKISINNSINEKNNNSDINKEFSLNETLKIISEIQKQFDDNVKANKKPLEIIKKIINNEYTIFTYIPLSDFQKENITKDIEKTSELRTKNYKMTFHYILSALEDIRNLIGNFVKEENNNNETNKLIDEITENEESNNSKIMKENKENIIEKIKDMKIEEKEDEDEKEIKIEEDKIRKRREGKNKRSKTLININSRHNLNLDLDDTDYKDEIMLENALIVPPKISGFNHQVVKEMTRMRSRKFSVYEHEKSKFSKIFKKEIKKDDEFQHFKHKSYVGEDICNKVIKRYHTEISQDDKDINKSKNDDNCHLF